MKKTFLSFLFVGAVSIVTIAQDTITNAEGSSYRFEKIAHLDASPVLSQGRTGTCWSFSALSFFESEMMRMGVKNPPVLSQMYVSRKAYEGKAEKYIRMDGKTNFSQGGAFHDIPYVIRNYGMVPQSIYSGLLPEQETYNHYEMFSVLEGAMKGLLNHVNEKGNSPLTNAWKPAINGILDAYFGADVKEFEYQGKKYTPKTFAESLNLNMDDYVSVTSLTNHPMNAKCFLAIQDNWAWGQAYNVNLDDLVKVTEDALKNGYTVAWGADVSEKGFNFRKGIAIVPEDMSTLKVRGRDNRNFSDAGADKISDAFLEPVKELEITPELRQAGYDNKTTTDDHGMHIVGMYKDQTGKTFFLVKNSWGTGNLPKGYFYVSENYFRYKTINIFLHKDGISKDVKKKLEL
ncbi:MAG: aminopeptidase C [Crocinitomicaceae bacterium]